MVLPSISVLSLGIMSCMLSIKSKTSPKDRGTTRCWLFIWSICNFLACLFGDHLMDDPRLSYMCMD